MTTPSLEPLSRHQLEAAHSWDEWGDKVPGRPEMTEFRRRLRYHQAQWRESNGHPMGTQPIAPKGNPGGARLVGSRLPLDYARQTGANFLTDGALAAVRARTAIIEPHQSIDHQRLWADLLWSPAVAFNLFGDLAHDLGLADKAVHTWFPDTPGTVSGVRFAHSPGRLDPGYLNSLRAFDVAFIMAIGDGSQGVIGVDTRYQEWGKPETPKPSNLGRYLEVVSTSGVFRPGATDALAGKSEFCEIWLEHLLLLSMLQHRTGSWSWGRIVVVRPAGNSDYASLCARYREFLTDESTFSSMTFEDLLDADALPARVTATLRARYIPT